MQNNYIHKNIFLLAGISFTFIIAITAYVIVYLPGFNRIGPLATAIIIAIIYRQLFGYPEKVRSGVQFSARYLLRLAIILYGLKLNIYIIFQDGLGTLFKGVIAIVLSIVLIIYIGKKMKANPAITLLLGIGTGVCGAAAIAAAAPIIQAKEEDTAISVGIIALIGTIFSIVYTLLLPILPISNDVFGIWSGLSLHELAHVALAADPAGENALALALLAKLGRVFLLVPLCFILMFWAKKRKTNNEFIQVKVPFPYFLIGFIGMSLLGTFVDINQSLLDIINIATTFILTAAMVGLGLSVSLKEVKNNALRPLVAMIVTSIVLSLTMYFVLLI